MKTSFDGGKANYYCAGGIDRGPMAREDDREALSMAFKKMRAELLGLKTAAEHVAMLQDRLSKAERDGLDRDEVLDAYTSALKRMVAPEEAEK